MSSGAQSYLSIIPADPLDPKAVPTGDGEQINFTDEDLLFNVDSKQSNHIRPDRMTSDIKNVGASISGGFNYELHFMADQGEKLLAAALWSEWEGLIAGQPPGVVDVEGGVIDGTAGTLDLTGATVQPDNIMSSGHVLHINGSTDNDGVFMITPTGTAHIYNITDTHIDETFAAGVTLDGSFLRNKSVYSPMFIERGHVDVEEYFQFMGMAVNTWGLEIPDQDIITGSYQFIGLDSELVQVPTSPGYSNPPTTPILSSSVNVEFISIDGVMIESCMVQSLSWEAGNAVTPKTGVSVYGACATTPHRFSVLANLTMYFENHEMFVRLKSGAEFSFMIQFVDDRGQRMTVQFPRCKMSADPINVTGIDDDVFENAEFQALAHNETGAQIIIYRQG